MRLAGLDRYETSAAIARHGWPGGSQCAILATGENFPDALGAAPLAKKFNAPILLTERDTLNPNTASILTELGISNVFIVGGTGVVSPAIENLLRSMGITTTRLAGLDRYETSVRVAEYMGGGSEVFLTVGEDFPDALSVGSIAANKSAPILLTEPNRLPDCVKQYINNHAISRIYVIGGTSLISNTVVSGLSNVERITGQDKYERNINIIDQFASEIDLTNVCIATGENFPDALSGSAFAALWRSPVILVSKNPSNYTINFIQGNKDAIDKVYILGGTGVMPDYIINNLFGP